MSWWRRNADERRAADRMDRPGLRSLGEVDQVPWRSLTHAYGGAADVPRMIRRLAAARDPGQAGKAEHALWCSVLHQGNVYDATAPALPFVLALMVDHPVSGPVLTSWLTDLDWTLDTTATWADQPEVVACRRALERALPSLVPLLERDSVEGRCTAAGFVGSCTAAAGQGWPALRERWQVESEDVVSADLLVGMGALARAAGRAAETLAVARPWWTSDDERRRCAAAHAMVRIDPDDEEPLRVLVDALPEGRPVPDHQLGYWGTGTASTIVEDLARSRAGFADPRSWARVTAAVAGAHERAAADMLRSVLRHAFPGGRADVPADPGQLTGGQRDVLEFLASGRVAFSRGDLTLSTASVLDEYGLPRDVERRRSWLGRSR